MVNQNVSSAVSPTAVPSHEPLLKTLAFLGKKVAYAAVVLTIIIFVSFFGLKLAGGMELGTAVPRSLADTAAYIGRLFSGDMGMTTAGSRTLNPLPVTEVIKERLPISLALIGLAMLLSAIIGLLLGMRAARSKSESAVTILIATIIGLSIPSFFAAFLLQWGVTSLTRIMGKPFLPVGGFGWDSHLVLPVLVLSARPVAQITRMAFVSLRDVLRQDYIRTALSKGIPSYQVTLHHILRNAAIPILTTIGISLRFSLSSLPVIELYFGIPGVGGALLKGIAQQDANLTVGLTLSFGAIFILLNMILELSYRFIDPRLWKTSAAMSVRQHKTTRQALKAWREDAVDVLSSNPLFQWIERRKRPSPSNPFAGAAAKMAASAKVEQKSGTALAWRNVLGNKPFVIGAIMVFGMIVILLFGLNLSPNNPYSTQGLLRIDGVLQPPPFAPSAEFPWGSDPMGRGILSLLLTGAQMTLSLAIMTVAARLAIGTLLGAMAGWYSGSRLDRVIVGLSEVVAAFPTLILAMILILAFGIRQGMVTFIWALSLAGWGEIMQYVRNETISIRPKAYIESAVAMGAHTPRLIGKHVLPQLFSALISLAALEMGSVLLLLGELGFISIFIGGGSFIELPGVSAALYSDVPEWGALLSNVRYYSRSYPWVALYPMLAFFITILSFNLLGEGVRRLIDDGSLVINRIFNKYSIGFTIALIFAVFWLQDNSGRAPFLREYAETFDGGRAIAHVELLAENGRSLGTPGQDAAAAYVAAQFEAFGLQAAGEGNSFFQERLHSYEKLLETPAFTIEDGGADPVYGTDYTAYPSLNMTEGEANGEIMFIGLGRPSSNSPRAFNSAYIDLDRADLSQNIVMVLSNWEADFLAETEKDGLLVVTDDPEKLAKRYTYSSRSGRPMNMFTGELKGEETPAIWISEETANRLLAPSGITVAQLRQQNEELATEEVAQLPINTTVSMSVHGEIVEKHLVRHVIGFWPGDEGYEGCDDCMDRELLVVMAQLDSPPLPPLAGEYAAANNNGSGVAIMLETIRLMKEAGYQPGRSILFVAYHGEGLDGGEFVYNPDITRFLQAKTGFATVFEPEAIIQLRGVGAGDGDRMELSAAGSLRLAELFETAARQTGVDSIRAKESINIGLIYSDDGGTVNANAAPLLNLSWQGWESRSRTPQDDLDSLSVEILEKSGRAFSLMLMMLGEEQNY